MNLIQMMVNRKVNNITPQELLNFGQQYQVALSLDQANKITSLLRGQNINIYDDFQRGQLLNRIASVTSLQTAQQMNSIFQQLT
jgi:hypothetical protein